MTTPPITEVAHAIQNGRLDLNDVHRSSDYVDGAQDMLDVIGQVVDRLASTASVDGGGEALPCYVSLPAACHPRVRGPIAEIVWNVFRRFFSGHRA